MFWLSLLSLSFKIGEDDGVPTEGTRPVFTEKPTIKGADNFSKVTFECRLIADPKPTIEWYAVEYSKVIYVYPNICYQPFF